MKILVTLKDPDGFHESIDDAVKESMQGMTLTTRERDALFEARRVEVEEALERWVECQGYVTIEFDTKAGTATVKPRA